MSIEEAAVQDTTSAEFDRMLGVTDQFPTFDIAQQPFGEKSVDSTIASQEPSGADSYNMPQGDYTFIDRV